MKAARKKFLRVLAIDHRYRRIRVATLSVSFAVMLAVPLLGLARVDLLGGQHGALAQATDALGGAVAIGIAAFCLYLVTFFLNAFLGRVLCGWGCPLAGGFRAADAHDAALPRRRRRAQLGLAAYSVALSTAVLPWWASPHGMVSAPALAVVLWLGGAVTIWLFARYWRWRFCRTLCPIGMYYSVVQTNHRFGVQFTRAGCTDCELCVKICPVELDPRALAVAPDTHAMPARHFCLVCGDCVRACEAVGKKRRDPPAPLRLGRG